MNSGRTQKIEDYANAFLPQDIIDKGKEMSEIYSWLYIIENTLRGFIDSKLREKYGQGYFSIAGVPKEIKEAVSKRKQQEAKNGWLSVRGGSDIYLTDFPHLADLITNNWDVFQLFFPDQAWVRTKISELAHCRNLIAHNSSIGNDEKSLVFLNYKQILKQIKVLSGTPFVQKKPWQDNIRGEFCHGLRKTSVFGSPEANGGSEFVLELGDIEIAPLSIRFYFEQVDVFYFAVYEDSKVNLSDLLELDTAYTEPKKFAAYKKNCKIQIGQMDIDSDGLDEIVVAIQDAETGSIQINILKYFPPAFRLHALRKENWASLGAFKVEHVLGDPEAFFKDNSVKIPRNLRGFYYEWTWVKDKFIYTGNF